MQRNSKVIKNPVKMRALGITFLILIIASCFGAYWAIAQQFAVENEWDGPIVTIISPNPTASTKSSSPPVTASTPVTNNASLPEKVLLPMSFTSQAPLGVWDPLHEDACEEASFLMVKYYIEDKKIASKQSVDEEIVDLVNYEEKNGYGLSITLQQLNTIVENHYGITSGVVKTGITNEDIKRELAAGHPVIIGAGGKLLKNPHFKNGGPVYHMLVIKGYDAEGFITNDPGTSHGEGYRYSYETIANAVHNWNEADITRGEKAMLVYY